VRAPKRNGIQEVEGSTPFGSTPSSFGALVDTLEASDLPYALGRLLAIQGDRFDAAFVRHWLVAMLGAADERIATWDQLVTTSR